MANNGQNSNGPSLFTTLFGNVGSSNGANRISIPSNASTLNPSSGFNTNPNAQSNFRQSEIKAQNAEGRLTTPAVPKKSGPPVSKDSNITRDTLEVVEVTAKRPSNNDSTLNKPQIESNVLNGYRSYTYNFKLAGLPASALDNPTPENFENVSNNYVILNSAGKGNSKITLPSGPSQAQLDANNLTQNYTEDPQAVIQSQQNIEFLKAAPDIVDGFNKNSPGRFDMFIDDVHFDTLLAFTGESNVTLPQTISFDVYEPYSINGFLEALQAASVACGYVNYTQSSFVLKIWFSGYPDSAGTPDPVLEIPGSTRYFIVSINEVAVEITERGTKYACKAVPWNERIFGDIDNSLRQSIQVVGKNVGDILNNFMSSLQTQRQDAYKKATTTPLGYDKYSIIFPSLNPDGTLDYNTPNKDIVDANFAINLKENKIFKFIDASDPTANPGAYKVLNSAISAADKSTAKTEATGESVVTFGDQANIHECIASVIVDSEFVRKIVSSIGNGENPDEYGMVTYFSIRVEVTNQTIIDDQSQRPFRNITYIVAPFKVPYTQVPGYSMDVIDYDKLSPIALRQYNYIYSGKNIDVLNFKLDFKNLYYEAMANNMANSDIVASRFAATKKNINNRTNDTELISRNLYESTPTKGRDPKADLTSNLNQGRPTAGQPYQDAYWVMARMMHNAVINANSSMVKGNLEIIGDPFYMATGGIGNTRPQTVSRGLNIDGSIDQNVGVSLIIVNFNNPVDVQPLSKGGLLEFDTRQVGFSGIYLVNKVKSSFRDGVFKQTLEITRMPQTDKSNVNTAMATGIDSKTDKPNPVDTVSQDQQTTNANVLAAITRPGAVT